MRIKTDHQQTTKLIPPSIIPIILFIIEMAQYITSQCPNQTKTTACSCYEYDKATEIIYLECPAATIDSIKHTLTTIPRQINVNLHIYDLDRTVNCIDREFLTKKVRLTHLQFTQTNLREFSENALENCAENLQSLAIISGKFERIPQNLLKHTTRLISLDFESNRIVEVGNYDFEYLNLVRLNLKGNSIRRIQRDAFAGNLEYTLRDLNLAENNLKEFPSDSLRRLKYLSGLKMAWNEISNTPASDDVRLDSLETLDLSSNRYVNLLNSSFVTFPNLRVLSMYSNSIKTIESGTFAPLERLETIDLSHNRIRNLATSIFDTNANLTSIDLSHNHLHELRAIFRDLVNLTEVFLNENNILSLERLDFHGCGNLRVLYLQQNSIKRLDSDALTSLNSLRQLHLSGNLLTEIPDDLFANCRALESASIDSNRLNRSLPIDLFYGCVNLREIRLHNNQIRGEIRESLFRNCGELQSIHLQGNRIEGVRLGTLPNLHYINLEGNLLGVFECRNCSNLRVVNLGMNNLQYLSIQQNSVEILELGRNEFGQKIDFIESFVCLTKLVLQSSRISHLEPNTVFDRMQNLKVLDLSVNLLEEIPPKLFANLRELEELYLAQNKLRNLPDFGGLFKLRVLSLASNPLKVLPDYNFAKNLPIRVLNLRNCSLERVRSYFKEFTNLNELNLAENRLESLREIQSLGLRTLKISSNSFANLRNNSLEFLVSLRFLDLAKCKIREIQTNAFLGLKNLQELDLSENLLKNVEIINQNIKELNLARNQIEKFPKNVPITLETLNMEKNRLVQIGNLSNVINANFALNQITQMPKTTKFLHKLDISFNKITRPDYYATLKSVNLSGNPLIINVTSTNQHLEELDLSHSNLTSLTERMFDGLPFIAHLTLTFNQISFASINCFKKLVNLQTLNLGFNHLETFSIENNRLNTLNLTVNRLREFPGNLSKQLTVLDLSENRLMEIKTDTFRCLENLAELYLNGNWIIKISPKSFEMLLKLRHLDLMRNYIEVLPVAEGLFDVVETQIRSVKINENPLSCDCEDQNVIKLWEWLDEHEKIVQNTDRISCEYPESLHGSVFLKSIPEFCKHLTIEQIQSSSLLVTWLFVTSTPVPYVTTVSYHKSMEDESIRKISIDGRKKRELRLYGLDPSTYYVICVGISLNGNNDKHNLTTLLWKHCTEVETLPFLTTYKNNSLMILNDNGLDNDDNNSLSMKKIFTRRLGLIVGCALGFCVFIVLLVVLGYLKMKKQKRRRGANDMWDESPPQINNYRHYSIHSCGVGDDYPNFITSSITSQN